MTDEDSSPNCPKIAKTLRTLEDRLDSLAGELTGLFRDFPVRGAEKLANEIIS